MIQLRKTKEQIYEHLQKLIEQKVMEADRAIEMAKEARDNDTKNTSGDKYETGRAMMQIEMENNDVQLSKALSLRSILFQIKLNRTHNKVEFGSLVITNQGNYFVSIGLGKIVVNGEAFYAISLASPIGQMLKDKAIGDTETFNGREFIINDIA